MPSLFLRGKGVRPREVKLPLRDVVVGRLPECDVVVDHPSLSRTHARFEYEAGRWRVVDLQSKNGTYINGLPTSRADIRSGDRLRLGDVEVDFADTDLGLLLPILEVPSLPGGDTPSQPPGRGPSGLNLPTLDAADRARDKLRILCDAAQNLGRLERVEVVAERVVGLLAELFDLDLGAVFLLGADGDLEEVATRATWHLGVAPTPSHSVARLALDRRVAMALVDAMSDQALGARESVQFGAIRSCMVAPLHGRDGLIGVVYVDHRRTAGRYTEEDLHFLVGIAGPAALAIENARLYERVAAEEAARQRLLRFFPEATTRQILAQGAGELAPTEGEVTALFCDISDFVPLAARLPPAEVLAILNAFFPPIAAAVADEEGTLEKYIGDAVMAVWGAPLPRPDDPVRALRAAVAMQRAMAEVNTALGERGVRLSVHIGLDLGRAAVGTVGTDRFLQLAAIGPPTNQAARVCALAPPGAVWVTDALRRRVGELFPFTPLPPAQLKGTAEPATVWQLEWERAYLPPTFVTRE